MSRTPWACGLWLRSKDPSSLEVRVAWRLAAGLMSRNHGRVVCGCVSAIHHRSMSTFMRHDCLLVAGLTSKAIQIASRRDPPACPRRHTYMCARFSLRAPALHFRVQHKEGAVCLARPAVRQARRVARAHWQRDQANLRALDPVGCWARRVDGLARWRAGVS
jgi:hypothetical protein